VLCAVFSVATNEGHLTAIGQAGMIEAKKFI
jgi:hypothetical protein